MRKPRGTAAGASGDEAGPLAEGTPPPKKRGRRASEGAGTVDGNHDGEEDVRVKAAVSARGGAARPVLEVFRVPARSAAVQVR